MADTKKRLDLLLVERGLVETRAKAQGIIMAGEVSVDGIQVDKPGARFAASVEIALRLRPAFVSRGGDKLAGALDDFACDPAERVCADVGASTGGFTDCLLQHGAARVYAIDVGYGQLAHKLRVDPRVIVMERTNARYLSVLPEPVNLIVIDASFISLRLLLPVVKGWLAPQADLIALIKPQFEAGRADVGKGGVVRQQAIHQRVIEEVVVVAQAENLLPAGLTRSRLKGPAGNVEFLIWLTHGQARPSFDLASHLAALLTGD